MKKLLAFASVLALAVVALCAPAARAADAPYDVDVVLSLSGPASFIGHAHQETFSLLEPLINKNGGIDGRQVHFVIHDDQSNSQTSVQLANAIIDTKKAVFLGPLLAAMCRATAPIAEGKIVDYCLSPAAYPPKGAYQFSTSVATRDQLVALMRYARSRGWTRIASLTSTDASGQDGDSAIGAALALPENKSLHLVAQEHFALTDISVAAQTAHLHGASPQAIVIWTTGTPFGTAIRGITDSGLGTTPVFTSNGNMTFAQMKQYGAFLPKELYFPGVAYTAQGALAHPNAQQRAFFAAFKAAGTKPDFQSGMPWDATMIIVDALRHIGASATPAKVLAYIENLDGYQGITGTYDFRSGNQRGLDERAIIVERWDGAKQEWTPVSGFGGGSAR